MNNMLKQGLAIVLITVGAFGCQTESLQPQSTAFELPPQKTTDKIIIRYCPDLVVNSVISYGVTGNTVNYGVAIRNNGNASATLDYTTNQVYWQAYLSVDGVTKNVAACGSTFNAMVLAPGQITWQSINCTFPASVNLYSYSSMIVELHVSSNIHECNSANNTFVRTPPPY